MFLFFSENNLVYTVFRFLVATEENVRGVEHRVATFQVGKEDMLYIIRPNKGVTTQDDRGSNSLEERERKIKEGTNSEDDSSQK